MDATEQQQRLRVFNADQVSKHDRLEDVWVVHKGKVYDVTDFVLDHPGGDDLVMRYAGKDMGDIMDDIVEHVHSDSAYELLEEHLIGKIATTDEEKAMAASAAEGGAAFSGKPQEIVITEDFKPTDTDLSSDFKKTQFLDLSRPLIMQVWNAKFSKEFYLEQVHSPRHLKEPARLLGPWYLEIFTRTSWYVPAMVWLPISAALFSRSLQQFSHLTVPANGFDFRAVAEAAHRNADKITIQATSQTLSCFILGIFIWTLLEYSLHRFLFHIDDLLPDRPFFLMLHFLLHGIHHYLPMDRLRLVMPPLLFFVLQVPFTKLGHIIFPASIANGIISGAFAMYVVYDTMHYALHHTKLPAHLRKMKKYHLEHHYKNYELGFGVTSRMWDYVFRTEL
ncbi:putative SCS7-required for hydroxylation of ceramide [Tilletiaria anomala UBC 951]|uniref:Ceramide very long chain fatty acid hydroxylase n=1 Tax=Tilletiaria anomala (strain ATCC 24038 / CBS 436.72 / UBC 951) TaxID=1037660 RepID=A0A066V888_TILAU|nr:putative SCS7-required for hydroxylation of ceramide [Tilletiaria anomala UBC 951]KDN37932.1 putative SCS7-required for hydroxylation of ceramide [Tilletiaria anomala UBC 951]